MRPQAPVLQLQARKMKGNPALKDDLMNACLVGALGSAVHGDGRHRQEVEGAHRLERALRPQLATHGSS